MNNDNGNIQSDAKPFSFPTNNNEASTSEFPEIIPQRPIRTKNKTNKKNNEVYEPPKLPEVPLNTATNIINITNASNIQFGNTFNYYTPTNSTQRTPYDDNTARSFEPSREKTDEHIRIMESEEMIPRNYIVEISYKVGKDWTNLFRYLDCEESNINNVYESYHSKGIPEVIFQLFLDWIQNGDKRLGELCKKLWDYGKPSLVDVILKLYNEDKKESDLIE